MRPLLAALVLAFCAQAASADFVEDFSGKSLATDPQGHRGWMTLTGSGEATMTFKQEGHHGVVEIDATKDRRNIWWAVIKRAVSPSLDRSLLGRSDKALQVETKIRLSEAPRRVNLSLNHTRTTDFHSNLAEFDIPDTGWHVISFTAKSFDAKPDDEVFAQMALMDGGRQRHRIEIAYFKVSVVDAASAPPDLGNPMPYRPALPEHFSNAVPVAQDAIIDSAWPDVNFRDWTELSPDEGTLGVKVLSVSGTQITILRFDLSAFKGKTADGWGILELTTSSAGWAPTNLEEFGYLRTVEIKSAAPDFERNTVTWNSLFQGKPVLDVLNGQLIYDVQPALQRAGKTRIAINPAVMQRLIDGTTKGLAIYTQGAVNATFASSEAPGREHRPTVYFNVK